MPKAVLSDWDDNYIKNKMNSSLPLLVFDDFNDIIDYMQTYKLK